MKTIILKNQRSESRHGRSVFIFFALCGFALSPLAQAAPQVVPAPDGCYPNYTTAEGCNALNFLTTGAGNTGVGWYSLFSNTDASFNTGIGGGALVLNNGDSNTAIGGAALLLNTSGTENTATGTDALVFNDSGSNNTAFGAFALFSNVDSSNNTAVGHSALYNNIAEPDTAVGFRALFANTTGANNTATGYRALESNIDGFANTAVGGDALEQNTSGFANTAIGYAALDNNTGGASNTAIGRFALVNNITGSLNTALGRNAGSDITGSGNVCIGANVPGEGGVDDSTYVRNVNTLAQPIVAGIDGVTVRLSDGRLGHGVSSRRYKEDIEPMDRASEALYALKPVTFHYKKEIDPTQTLDFGLIAEQVAEVNPELAVRDRDGKISNYRRDAINAMLLNEFLKEHKKVDEQQANISLLNSKVADQAAIIAQQQKEMEVFIAQLKKQAAQIQKVNAHLEIRNPAAKVVVNKP